MEIQYKDKQLAMQTWKKFRHEYYYVGVKLYLNCDNSYLEITHSTINGEKNIHLEIDSSDFMFLTPMRFKFYLECTSAFFQQLLRDCYIEFYHRNIDHLGFPDSDDDDMYHWYMDTVHVIDKKGIKYTYDKVVSGKPYDRCVEFYDADGWYIRKSFHG